MSNFINEQNKKINSNEILDKQIENVFINARISNDDVVENIFARYHNNSESFSLNDQEIQELDIILKQNVNKLIKLSIFAILVCFDNGYENDFIEAFKSYLDLCFEQKESNDILIYFNNLDYIITIIIDLSKKNKNQIKEKVSKIFSKKIRASKKMNYDIFSTIYHLMIYDFNFFDKTNFIKLNEIEFEMNIDSTNFCQFVKYFQKYIYFLDKVNKKRKCNETKIKYCKFILKYLDQFKITLKTLYEIKGYMLLKPLKDKFNNAEFNRIDNKIELEKEQFLDSLYLNGQIPNEDFTHKIEVLKENELNKYKKLILNNIFSQLNENIEKCINSSSIKETKDEKSNECYFDLVLKENKIVFIDELTSEELKCYKHKEYFELECEINYLVYFKTFFEINNKKTIIKKELSKIFENNKAINKIRKKYLINKFTSFFKEDYINSTYDIVLEFEEILRLFFKENGLNIYKNEKDLIGINNIFDTKDAENNVHLKMLKKEIGKTYFDAFKYLLYEKYGCDIRNRISHRYDSGNLYKSYEIIHLVMLIFNFIYRQREK